MEAGKAHFHLPGLFEYYEFYEKFLPLFYEKREYFYDWADIGSIYGAPADCIWSGGRLSYAKDRTKEIIALLETYGISARLTFSNSLLQKEHLTDALCNRLCKDFSQNSPISNGVIVHSDLLMEYLRNTYPNLYLISSTTKTLTTFESFEDELSKEEFSYVVPDFRINNCFDKLFALSDSKKAKVEFLCNECCDIGCINRKACYENVSKLALDLTQEDYICKAPYAKDGYKFSKAMDNPSFIGIEEITKKYLPNGFSNFKIEGRSLGTGLILEFLLYYLTKPQFHIHVREEMYLDNMLDLF